ncbi:bacillithiol biosynthesis deacetylase BshB2 [Pseudogracilibacillus auburnensis]|uniref:Bacillithiol biosynthesis deacetylase BshB2 n=1 Tax=Pseudogracilibacillus auburnensis TaxID=1494959 RepID=A0A2V3W5V9_9BACI|nr:bacillithiol biosynthesis deacetylase BshB2 [Pseudogracilibacillus auburnensis]MBO1001566.1 bacillithiol biosynthesis deacetylase BshB2 [Pseudogracilibacillus auburnensis]PXW89512.1 bacillithiol biosynthesis deacetylase BshB2 [Pseudogracilibacillus auburnensis]
MESQKHVVIVYPHPDDESFGAAGSIYQFRKQGIPVTYLCGTLGEMGRNMGTPPFANRETLPKIREKELQEACEFLDIDYRLLGYRDKTIEFENKEKVATHVKTILEEIKPTLVITHYPEHGVHPDHNALGEATIEAVRLMDPDDRPTIWASAITKDFEKVLGEPDVIIPVKDQFDFKLEAILKHKSQAEGMLKKMQNMPDEMKVYIDGLKERLGKERFFIWNFESN